MIANNEQIINMYMDDLVGNLLITLKAMVLMQKNYLMN